MVEEGEDDIIPHQPVMDTENGTDTLESPPPPTTAKSVVIQEHKPFIGIYITFGERMAKFFNMKDNQYILLGCFGFPIIKYSDYYMKLSPNFGKPKIEKMMIYSDIVKPIVRVGDYHTNLLDVISVDNSNIIHRPYVGSGYKPLRKHNIDSVSILCTNDRGGKINFEKNKISTFELHISPQLEK